MWPFAICELDFSLSSIMGCLSKIGSVYQKFPPELTDSSEFLPWESQEVSPNLVSVGGWFYVHTRPDMGKCISWVHTKGHMETFPTVPVNNGAALSGCIAVEYSFQKVSLLYS